MVSTARGPVSRPARPDSASGSAVPGPTIMIRRIRRRIRAEFWLSRLLGIFNAFANTGLPVVVAFGVSGLAAYQAVTQDWLSWATGLLPTVFVVVAFGVAVLSASFIAVVGTGLFIDRLYRRHFANTGHGAWTWEREMLSAEILRWEVIVELAFHPRWEISHQARATISELAEELPLFRLTDRLRSLTTSPDKLRASVLAVFDPDA